MNLINVNNVDLFTGNELILKDISFSVSEAGSYGFLGKSNSGAEQLAEILAGVTEYDSGSIFYGEEKLFGSDKQTANIKTKIGYVPRRSFLDGRMTVRETLELCGELKENDPDMRSRQIKEALELLGLSERMNVLTGELTAANKRKLMLANALIGSPQVIIFDEPFYELGASDVAVAEKLISLLARKKTVLLFSSSADVIERNCEYTAILINGRLALFDKTDEALARSGKARLSELFDVLSAKGVKNGEGEENI